MQDLEEKCAFLTYYVEVVCRIACALQDDHLARLYGRAQFLAIDSFLKLAPALKNELLKANRLTKADADALKGTIKTLSSDYEGYYATVRDKVGAHQQEVDLALLLECWNEIDESTLTILRDDVAAIWAALEAGGATPTFRRPPELDDATALVPPGSIRSLGAGDGVRIGLDRVALTRSATTSMIGGHPAQEKGQRVITALDNIRQLIDSRLEHFTASWVIAEKASVDLIVVDACSLLDNLFTDDPRNLGAGSDPSLVSIWATEGIKGQSVLAAFNRDHLLEAKLRRLRNKFCAHVDGEEKFKDLLAEAISFPLADLDAYLQRIWKAFEAACALDVRTRVLLIHGRKLEGVVGVEDSGAVKPFRTTEQTGD
jgi:hypothetical protein